MHALLGENGAGKSTLIKMIGGAVRPNGGSIAIDGAPVEFATPADALAMGIAIIYQELVLCPHLSVTENVLMGHLPRTAGLAVDWPEARRRVRDLLAELGVALPLDAPVGRLSTAQQQLVEIAKALSRDSRILVLDEPSAALGQSDLEHLFGVIARLKARGVAIIYISHRLEEVFEIADRVTVLKDGKLVGGWPIGEVTMSSLVRAMTGRELTHTSRPVAAGRSASAPGGARVGPGRHLPRCLPSGAGGRNRRHRGAGRLGADRRAARHLRRGPG